MSSTKAPTEGALKVWYVPQVPMPAYEVLVPDLATARIVLDALVGLSAHEYQHNVKPDYADASGVARYETDGEGGFDWFDVDLSEWASALEGVQSHVLEEMARDRAADAIARARDEGLHGRAALTDAHQTLTSWASALLREGDDLWRPTEVAATLVWERIARTTRLDGDPAKEAP